MPPPSTAAVGDLPIPSLVLDGDVTLRCDDIRLAAPNTVDVPALAVLGGTLCTDMLWLSNGMLVNAGGTLSVQGSVQELKRAVFRGGTTLLGAAEQKAEFILSGGTAHLAGGLAEGSTVEGGAGVFSAQSFSAVACTMSLAACGADETGKIRIGIKFDQPGLGFKKSGTYVGFDVDVAKYIAKKLGYSEDQIIWKEAPSKQREAMIQNGDVDMILATYSITDERKKAVSFAGPYFVAGQDLLVRKDDNSINGPEDLNGKRLCSVTGSTSAATVKEKFASEVQLMEQPGYAECATALFSGIVDAVTTDDIILAGLASASRGKLKVVGKPFTQEHYGVGIKKGDTQLATKINNAIVDMIQDGSWENAISDNTKGTNYTPDVRYNPPTPDEGEEA